ncbi:hypothetical protein [Agrobacterium radiobacter]|uniref:hypothetical protein n=1 Tax=Agrobacterium radiobacter TaxID=362 RepID=UPI003CE517D7
MDMTMLQALDATEPTTFAFGYRMQGQPDPDSPVSMEHDVLGLPIRHPDYEILAGEGHPEAPSFMRDYANMVRCMAGPCELVGGPTVQVPDDKGKRKTVPSDLLFVKARRPGSNLVYRKPVILISTTLTPSRPTPTQARRANGGKVVDSAGLPVTDLIGAEEVLLQIGVWAIYEANRIWPGDDETPSWLDRVWQSLHEDQDPSRMTPGLDRDEEVVDAFIEFALTYLRNAALARNAVMDDIPFHTQEFARIVTGNFAREVAEYGEQLWPER